MGKADPQTDRRPTEKTLCQICSQQVDSDPVYSLTPCDSHVIFLAQQRLLAALALGGARARGTELYNVCKI